MRGEVRKISQVSAICKSNFKVFDRTGPCVSKDAITTKCKSNERHFIYRLRFRPTMLVASSLGRQPWLWEGPPPLFERVKALN